MLKGIYGHTTIAALKIDVQKSDQSQEVPDIAIGEALKGDYLPTACDKVRRQIQVAVDLLYLHR